MSASPAPEVAAESVGIPAARWTSYAELTKPGLTGLVVVTTALGFLLGCEGSVHGWRLLGAIVGTALAGGGANGLNQWWEAGRDARMRRTRDRPLPSGRVSPRGGFVFSAALTGVGLLVLFAGVNSVAGMLALASWGVYLLLYTPLKPRTTLNTIVGAVSGALPPMIGWSAATGRLDPPAFVLFAILFVWQIPHFLAIAWVYREDYAGGGFRMLPVVDPAGHATFRIVVVYCLVLVPVAYTAALVGLSGWIYLVGSTLLGLVLLAAALRLYRDRTVAAARGLFLTTIAYLPALLLLMLLDPTRL
jgi:protoheme IX farnesyltransferase